MASTINGSVTNGQPARRIMDTIHELKGPTVHMRNPQRVEDFLCQSIRDGKSKLAVAADFDFTMSRAYENGIKCQTCHGALNTSPLIPKSVQEQSLHLFETYHPIELDHTISMNEKGKFMIEWWTKAADLIVNTQLNKSDIKRIVKESRVRLRSGCDSLIQSLNEKEIPLMVISAGLGDLIVEAITQQSTLHSNIEIVANFMEFNNNGTLVAFKNETIHCCNKNETPIHHSECFKRIEDRTNAILIGDLLEDSNMLNALPHLQSVLKIGFLNDNQEEFLPKFLEKFDIVLVNDQTFDVVNGLLRKLF